QKMEDAALAAFHRNLRVLDSLPATSGNDPDSVRIDAGQSFGLQRAQDLQDYLSLEVEARVQSLQECRFPGPCALGVHLQRLQDQKGKAVDFLCLEKDDGGFYPMQKKVADPDGQGSVTGQLPPPTGQRLAARKGQGRGAGHHRSSWST